MCISNQLVAVGDGANVQTRQTEFNVPVLMRLISGCARYFTMDLGIKVWMTHRIPSRKWPKITLK